MNRTMKLALTGIGTLALLASVGLGFVSGCASPAVGLAEGRLLPCPGTPNCVSSDDTPPDVPPFAFAGDADVAFAELVAFLDAEPRVELVTVEPEYVHAVFRTKWLRFADDVEFRLDREARVIAVRSASRVGYSDLGANATRVADLRTRWSEHSPPPASSEDPAGD